MQWSQLKKRIEQTFADKLQGRVEVFSTSYRQAADPERFWISFDKKVIVNLSSDSFEREVNRVYDRKKEDRAAVSSEIDYSDIESVTRQLGEYTEMFQESQADIGMIGIVHPYYARKAMFEYLSLSIDDALRSNDPVIRGLCMLDRRFGRRRLEQFDASNESSIVQALYNIRCSVERLNSNNSLQARRP